MEQSLFKFCGVLLLEIVSESMFRLRVSAVCSQLFYNSLTQLVYIPLASLLHNELLRSSSLRILAYRIKYLLQRFLLLYSLVGLELQGLRASLLVLLTPHTEVSLFD